jgi:hypothetical protein
MKARANVTGTYSSVHGVDTLLDSGPPKRLWLAIVASIIVFLSLVMWFQSVRYLDTTPIELTFRMNGYRNESVCPVRFLDYESGTTVVPDGIGYLTDIGAVRSGQRVRIASIASTQAIVGKVTAVSATNGGAVYLVCVELPSRSAARGIFRTGARQAKLRGEIVTGEARFGDSVFGTLRSLLRALWG